MCESFGLYVFGFFVLGWSFVPGIFLFQLFVGCCLWSFISWYGLYYLFSAAGSVWLVSVFLVLSASYFLHCVCFLCVDVDGVMVVLG